MQRDTVPGRTVTIIMARKKPVIILIVIISFLALLAIVGLELTHGLSLTRGLRSLAVKEIYVMGDMDKLYLSIDLDPSEIHLNSIRVPLEEISIALNPALATDMTISSAEYIWGDRWPWVEKVTITLKTERQKEGFDKLFKPEKLEQLQDDLKKGSAVGVTHSGLLTSGGRMMEN